MQKYSSAAETACRKGNYSRDTVNIRHDSSNRDNRNIMDVSSSQNPPESDSRKGSSSRETATLRDTPATAAGTHN